MKNYDVARDTKLKEALQEFFAEDGDMTALDYVLQDAINSTPIESLPFTHAAKKVLRTACAPCSTIAPLRGKSYKELVNMPGMTRGAALLVQNHMSAYERRSYAQLAENVESDANKTRGITSHSE